MVSILCFLLYGLVAAKLCSPLSLVVVETPGYFVTIILSQGRRSGLLGGGDQCLDTPSLPLPPEGFSEMASLYSSSRHQSYLD